MKFLHALFLFAIVICALPLFGQVQSSFYKEHLNNHKWQEGMITKKDGQQVAGLIKGSLEEPVNVKGVTFIAIDGMDEETYSAKELQGFTISILYRFVSYQDHFYQIVHQGKRIALLRRVIYTLFVSAAPNAAGASHVKNDDFYLRKNGEETLFRITGEKKKLSAYFADCDSLAKKIKAGEYKTGSPVLYTDPDKKKQVLVDVIGYYDYCE